MKNVISLEELKNLIDSGKTPTIIEALPKSYYEAEHLPGAINIPHDEILSKADQNIPDRGATVVVYCASAECQNSHVAAEGLRQLGYSNVYEFIEGKKGWKEAGLSFEVGGSSKQ